MLSVAGMTERINRFGQWLKAARLTTTDPASGKPYSQARLAEALDVSSTKIAAWERGEIASVSVRDASVLARILNRGEDEILRAIGYAVDEGLSDDDCELLAAFRQLPPLQRTIEKERLRILVDLLRQSGQLGETGSR